jgi:hypothetical protein
VHVVEQRVRLERLPRTRTVLGEEELAYAMARLALADFGVSAAEAEGWGHDARASARGRPPEA